MPPTDHEVYRYTDPRGDTIVFKFDASLLHSSLPSSTSPAGASPLTIFHEWRLELANKIQLSSMWLDAESAAERYKKDRKPAVGFVLWQGKDREGRDVVCRFVGWERSERGFVVELGG